MWNIFVMNLRQRKNDDDSQDEGNIKEGYANVKK